MITNSRSTITLVPLTVLSLLLSGCAIDRSDARAVSEATFRAIMAKDHQQLREMVGPGGRIPDEPVWSQAAFIRDMTSGEGIKERWVKGSIGGYALGELTLDDYQGVAYRPGKLAQIHFVLEGKSYVATFPVLHVGNQWSPSLNPSTGEFFIRFQET